MKVFLTPMLAVVACLALSSVTARAENHPTGVALKTSSVNSPAPPSGGLEGLSLTSVTTGTSGFFPCYNCAGTGSVSLPYEQKVIKAGSSLISTIQMQDTFFYGYPTVTYVLVQGGSVVSSSSVTFPFELVPAEEALAYFPDTAPSTTGPATIIMSVTNGSQTIGTISLHLEIF